MQTETYWADERKFLGLTVLDESTDPATAVLDYEVTLVPLGGSVDDAVWSANTLYEGKHGLWVDDLPAGVHRVLARAGAEPDEVDVVECGTIYVRSR